MPWVCRCGGSPTDTGGYEFVLIRWRVVQHAPRPRDKMRHLLDDGKSRQGSLLSSTPPTTPSPKRPVARRLLLSPHQTETAVRGFRFRLVMTGALILLLAGEASSEPVDWAEVLATETVQAASDTPPVLLPASAFATPTPPRAENPPAGTGISITPPVSRAAATPTACRGKRSPFRPSLQEEFPQATGVE